MIGDESIDGLVEKNRDLPILRNVAVLQRVCVHHERTMHVIGIGSDQVRCRNGSSGAGKLYEVRNLRVGIAAFGVDNNGE